MKILEHNVETGEVVERNATIEEIKQMEFNAQQQALLEQAKTTKAAARQAVLDRLGITAEEAQLILGGSN
jgi:hypothetical protein